MTVIISLSRLEAKLTDMSASASRKTNFVKLLEVALSNHANLSNEYKNGTIEKRTSLSVRYSRKKSILKKMNFEPQELIKQKALTT